MASYEEITGNIAEDLSEKINLPLEATHTRVEDYTTGEKVVMTFKPKEESQEVDLKDFSDKLPMEDIKPICLRAISEVMKYGRQKYGNAPEQKCSYENGEIGSYVGALLRHLNEYQYGNETDYESELPHLWHVLMNAYILCLLDEQEKDLNSSDY